MSIITYAPTSIPPGNILRIGATFYDPNNTAADPTTVIVWVTSPFGTVSQFNPLRDTQGNYHCDIPTATPLGAWYYRWQGLGSIIAQSPNILFNVLGP